VTADKAPSVKSRRLYHYACEHSVQGILADGGLLKPNPHAGQQKLVDTFVYPVVWLTDVDVRDHADACLIGLGNLNGIIECDRTRWRFIVPRVGVVPWHEWADANPINPTFRAMLELGEGCDPERWFVCPGPLRGARLDERYRGPVL
jgi:hypothetical protein